MLQELYKKPNAFLSAMTASSVNAGHAHDLAKNLEWWRIWLVSEVG